MDVETLTLGRMNRTETDPQLLKSCFDMKTIVRSRASYYGWRYFDAPARGLNVAR
jgi:hypothetical protein